MNNTTIFVVTEQILTDNITSITAFTTLDKAEEYVKGLINEYNIDGADIINDGLNWYDENLDYFDILITATMVK